MNKLAQKHCLPCEGGVPALEKEKIGKLLQELQHEWKVINSPHLEKEFYFKDFKGALAFTNKIGAVAEKEGHHPDILLGWGKVKVTIFTHSINGLTESDFILAAKMEKM